MALPGSFSNRGDWQLAVLVSSRSRHLGELAIKELNRPKAAMIRLQTGVGLPMFDFKDSGENPVHSNIRTGLPSPYGGSTACFSYDFLRAIAPLRPKRDNNGHISSIADPFPGHTDLHPIYRSEIADYLKEHALFLKAMCRLLVAFSETHTEHASRWIHYPELFEAIESRHLVDALMVPIRGEIAETAVQHFHTWHLFKGYLRSLDPLSSVVPSN
jgi:hypothetical protein